MSRRPRGAPQKARPMRSFDWSEWANGREDSVAGMPQCTRADLVLVIGFGINHIFEVSYY